MVKSVVLKWRLTPDLKSALEEAARRRGMRLSQLLTEIVESWLEAQRETANAERGRTLP